MRNALAIGVASGGLDVQVALEHAVGRGRAGSSGQRRWLWTFGSAIGEPHMTSVFSSRLLSPSCDAFRRSSRYGSWPTRNLLILLKSMIAVFAIAVVRRRVERQVDAALREHAVLRVAAGLERDDARHVGLEREHLQVEHQAACARWNESGTPGRRVRQRALLRRWCCALRWPGCGARSRCTCCEVAIEADAGRAAPSSLRSVGHFTVDAVEDAAAGLAARRRDRPASRRCRTACRRRRAGRESSAAARSATPS